MENPNRACQSLRERYEACYAEECLQKSLLVIGKEEDATGECRLYMLDEVFDIFKKLTDGHLKMLTDATKIFADSKLKEINAAGKASDEAKPIVFRPALTKNPPQMPGVGRMMAYQLNHFSP